MTRKVYILAFAILCFSYPITTVAVLQTGLDTGLANQAFKAGIMGLFLIAGLIAISRPIRPFALPWALIMLFALYTVRILNDVLLGNIFIETQDTIYVFGFFFGLTILPMIVMLLSFRPSHLPDLHRWVFYFLIAANLSLIVHNLLGGEVAAADAFSSRSQVEGELAGTAVLNPILFGLMGAMLAAFALGRLATGLSRGMMSQAIHMALIAIGCLNILFGASRGPAIAFVICLLGVFYALLRGGVVRKGFKLRSQTWIYFAVFIAGFFIMISVVDVEIYLFDRFLTFYEERTSGGFELRDQLFSMAWDDFLSNPFLGSGYLIAGINHYPHNIVVEAFMATGIFGGALMIFTLFSLALSIVRIFHGQAGPHAISMALAMLCLLTIGMTSSSIFQSPELWVFAILILLVGQMKMQVPSVRQSDYRTRRSERPKIRSAEPVTLT